MRRHREGHLVQRIGWLRAAVLGANDGILSTASLIVGVAAANASQASILITGIAGLVAGAMSMAAGEYVSVSSQADTERADIARETAELNEEPEAERLELAAIYRQRGLDHDLALQVADQLMSHDALGAHLRDELGISEEVAARPVQAALASAASFATGAILPVLTVLAFSGERLVVAVTIVSLALLATTGAIGARTGGASIWRGAARVVFWGALAMAVTAGIGHLFGARV
ncbi:VIT family protein [Sphingomonas sp.]|jgi:VIT1/CCC1 family predicted Fe2+/Mn2+ transporter|uniref:VIT1/CCC1 transporter family protein n=1 Tax=Sphingomonas sp. TaxID=28214 RepID=UPI002E31E015|nr:VIT family protein [Sphingomonas sp.]HEX4694852.1 VIT family protein [Sphingomonas sp.]